MSAPRPDLLQFVDTSPWRAELTRAQLDRVILDTSMRNFDAGSTVCLRGSPSMHWLAVVEGMLKVDTVSADGRATTFAGVPAGAWFGEGAVLKGEPRPYGVVAIRDSSVAFMPRETFLWLLDESRGFSRWVIDQLNARLAHYIGLVESFRQHDLTARVAYCVSEMFNPQLYPSTSRALVISQEEIARLCGLARQNTNRALHKLEEAGLLRISYGVIEVIDLEGLQDYARER
jgi:CRP/FNR family cyclic AMP-dependent transcriptional regulator